MLKTIEVQNFCFKPFGSGGLELWCRILTHQTNREPFFSLKFPQAKKDVVKAFLEWTDGLVRRPSNAKPIVIVTCSALKEHWIFFPAILGTFSQRTGP